MKNFWRQVTGPTGKLSKTRRERLTTTLLSPFFFLLLVSFFVGSMGAFLLRMIERQGTKMGRKIETRLGESNLPEMVKITLQKMVPWTATIVLSGLVAGFFGYTLADFEVQMRGKLGETERGERRLLQQTLALPEGVKMASGEARVELLPLEMQELTRLASTSARMDLSQEEKINLALAYFYLGEQEKYKLWLQAAREMDPNESFFAD